MQERRVREKIDAQDILVHSNLSYI